MFLRDGSETSEVAWHEYDPKGISVNLFSQGGDVKVKSISLWEINSIYTAGKLINLS